MVTQRAEKCNMTLDEWELEASSPTAREPPKSDTSAPINAATTSPKYSAAETRLTRYLPPNKSEAFIGALLPNVSETTHLIKRECPSLRLVPSSHISLSIRFDGTVNDELSGVMFRITPQAWPRGLDQVLPIIFIGAKETIITPASQVQTKPSQGLTVTAEPISRNLEMLVPTAVERSTSTVHDNTTSGTTWDDLVKQGALLGIHGGPNHTFAPLAARAESPSSLLKLRQGGDTWDDLLERQATLGIHNGPNTLCARRTVVSDEQDEAGSGALKCMVLPHIGDGQKQAEPSKSRGALSWEAMKRDQVVLGGHC